MKRLLLCFVAGLPCLAAADPATELSIAYRETGDADEAEIYIRRRTALTLGPFDVIYGASATDRGAFWIGAGLGAQLDFAGDWALELSVLPGLYENGGAADLGSVVEFRSSIGVSRRLGRGRLGIGFDHISNAGIGEDNPGSDGVFLRYALPTR